MAGSNFTRPTLSELFDRVATDIEGELSGVTARLRRRVERALAFSAAAVSDGLHGHLSWVADQILPDFASEFYLVRWASLFGVTRKVAERSTGNVTVTGTGGTLTAGTHQFQRPADGRLYDITVGATNIDPSAQVTIRAVDGGDDGDVEAGQTLALVSPVAQVVTNAIVSAGGISGGSDLESLDDLLARLLDRIQRPPLGGAPGDHVTWALEVPGVTRVWEYAGLDGVGNPGAGKVAVTFTMDDRANIIPLQADIDDVQAYLDARSPAQVIVFAPTPVTFAPTIALAPNTGAVRAAVTAELDDFIRREAEPGGLLLLSLINEAISVAAGELDHNLISPVTNTQYAFGQIAVLGTVTYQTL